MKQLCGVWEPVAINGMGGWKKYINLCNGNVFVVAELSDEHLIGNVFYGYGGCLLFV